MAGNGGWRASWDSARSSRKLKPLVQLGSIFRGRARRPSRRRVGRPSCHALQRNAMANVEDIPFIVEDRRMLSRVAGDRSEFWGFGGLPC